MSQNSMNGLNTHQGRAGEGGFLYILIDNNLLQYQTKHCIFLELRSHIRYKIPFSCHHPMVTPAPR